VTTSFLRFVCFHFVRIHFCSGTVEMSSGDGSSSSGELLLKTGDASSGTAGEWFSFDVIRCLLCNLYAKWHTFVISGGIKILAGTGTSNEGATVLIQAGALQSSDAHETRGGDVIISSGVGTSGGDVLIKSAEGTLNEEDVPTYNWT